ncbi:MAG: hypothetical protein AB1384_08050 [Actinomycetota bacterium]
MDEVEDHREEDEGCAQDDIPVAVPFSVFFVIDKASSLPLSELPDLTTLMIL